MIGTDQLSKEIASFVRHGFIFLSACALKKQ